MDARLPAHVEQLTELGLPVKTDLPLEVYELMDLYPQAAPAAVRAVRADAVHAIRRAAAGSELATALERQLREGT